jgi:hypothetical protein
LATAAEYVDPADAKAKTPGGLGLFIDSTDVDTLSVLIRPDSANYSPVTGGGKNDIEFFLTGPQQGYNQDLKPNPFAGYRCVLPYISAIADSTNAWTINIYGVTYDSVNPDGVPRERLVYTTSATADVTEEVLDFTVHPLISAPGETFKIQIVDDALVTGNIQYIAFFIPVQ